MVMLIRSTRTHRQNCWDIQTLYTTYSLDMDTNTSHTHNKKFHSFVIREYLALYLCEYY